MKQKKEECGSSGRKRISTGKKSCALNFDLIQEELKKQFKNPLTAYGKLGKVLEGLGYEKRQIIFERSK